MTIYEELPVTRLTETTILTIPQIQDIYDKVGDYKKIVDRCTCKDGDPEYGYSCFYQMIIQHKYTKKYYEASVTTTYFSRDNERFDRRSYEFTEIEKPTSTKAVKKVRGSHA